MRADRKASLSTEDAYCCYENPLEHEIGMACSLKVGRKWYTLVGSTVKSRGAKFGGRTKVRA
jgi:hypothetical protein